jgi:hypothetical protein
MKHRPLFFFVLLAACGGKSSEPAPVPPAPDAPVAAPATSYDTAHVEAAMAQCADPHGQVDQYSTVGQLSSKLVGAWLRCPRTAQSSLPEPAGIGLSLMPDGRMYVLEKAADGSIVQSHGLDEEANFKIQPPYDSEANNMSLYVYAEWANGNRGGFWAKFESGPRRMRLDYVDEYWFIPLDR